MNRRTFMKRIALGSIATASLPLLGVKPALADSSNEHRVYDLVAFSQAPVTSTGVLPRMGLRGCGTFDANAGWVKGGGSFVLSDQNSSTPKTIIVAGTWEPIDFVSYNTLDLPSYGNIQPSVLDILANVDGVGSGLRLRLICNVGAAGAEGSTGQPEGFNLFGTSFGDFLPLTTSIIGITHISVEGFSIDRGA
jgi:hypothetical protein